jgi:hypothetical protein
MKTKFVTAISAMIVGAAAPALLFLGAGTAYAAPDGGTVETQDSTEMPGTAIEGFDPQPDLPSPTRSCRPLVVNGILVCDSWS